MWQHLVSHVKDFGLFHKRKEKLMKDFKKHGGVRNITRFAFKNITVAAMLRIRLTETRPWLA